MSLATLSRGDAYRLCPHNHTVAHPLPHMLPTVSSANRLRVVWSTTYQTGAGSGMVLSRCLDCGSVGEEAHR